jgi:2',3'-cyclic-nucleotide 2'-phosphodiesterase (5'-nucleotidase family)/phosphodiesterase/alkaline phosphatase D-like protein
VVKVKATGLTADTTYYYQFTYNGNRSPIGRTRTAPAPGSNRVVKYAAINCNDFVGRYFNALKHLADQEAETIDFVLNLGDYIYETTGDPGFQTTTPDRAMVLSNPSEAIALGGGNYAAQSIGNYRDLYKTIRQDRQLQRVHELFPMISIWDDHEFSDDNWKDNATYFDGKTAEQQTARKRNGEQAWMEFLPTERGLANDGLGLEIDASDLYPNTVIYDAFNFGGNLDLITTDIRTGRADHLIPEDVCPSGVPMTEENVIATLAAANGLSASAFSAAVWPGLRGNFAPYVNIDDPALASVKGAFKAIIGAMADAAFASLPAGQVPVSTGAQYADASVTGLRDAAFINQVFAGAGFPAPFSASDLAAMPRGLSYYLLGKTSLFSEFGSRYQVVNQTFQIYAGYTYQAFLLSGGVMGRDQAFFDSAQQSFLGGALASSSTAGRAWRVVASSTPYTPIQFELGDLPSGVTLPTLGSISGVTIPASIPSQFLVEFLLNADEPAGFPQFRKGILDLLAQHDAILVSGDIHAQLVGNNLASNGQRVVDFTVPSAASSEFRRAVSGAFASVESLMTPSVRAATGLSGDFTFNPAQKQAVIDATDGIIKKNTAEMFEADTASHGYTVFTATPGAFTANYRKINVGYVDDNLYGETPAALDALFSRQHYVVSKTGTGATTDLSLGVPTTVTPTVAANTGGSVSGGGELVTGSSATFTATAASGYTFRGWTVNGSTAGSANPLNVTVTAGMTVEARFSYGLQLLHLADGEAGLLAPQTAPNLAALVDHFDGTYANTLILAGGDNFIPSPFLYGGTDPSVRPVLNTVTGSTISLSSSTNHPIAAVDIAIHNVIGVEASTIGNHEFDLGSRVFRDAFTPGSVTGWVGAAFPYLSANLNFSGDLDLNPRFTDVTLNGTTTLVPAASAGNGRIVPMAVVTKGGEKIGLLGATTQLLQGISSPTGTTVKGGGGADNMDQLAGVLQPYIDELIAEGVNKIVLMAHLQQIANEQLLATKLSGVDVILAGGSNTRLGDADDVAAVFPGHAASFANPYPISTAGADGKPVLIVNTDNEYTYVGRLVIDFDANGEVITSDLAGRTVINGAYAATAARVAQVWGVDEANLATTAFAAGTKGARVKALTDAVQSVIVSKDGDVKGFTNVYLEGERALIRNQETNLGNLTADANAAALLAMAPTGAPVVSFKNGGGIRAQIGATEVGSGAKIPPVANPGAGKPSGAVSVLDIENSLRFNNRLMVFDTTPAGLKAILEHGVASLGTQGRFPQIGGVSFAYDPARPAGDRITRIALTGGAGQLRDAVYDGSFSPWAPPVIRLVTLNFLAGNTVSATGLGTGGDGYPIRANGSNFRFLLDNGTLSAPVDPTLNFTAADVVPANALGEQTALGNYFAANHATTATAYDVADTPESSDLRIQNLSLRSNAVPYDLSLLLGGDGTGGLGGVSVGAGGRQGIRLSLGSRRVVVIASSGGSGLGAEVLDAGGAVVGSYSGSGEIALNLELGAGDYLIRVSNGGSATRVLGLTVDASGVPAPKPDLAVGRTLGTLVGVEAYGAPSTQQRVETTRTLAPVRSVVAAWNRGGGSEVLVLRATKDASDFRTTYVSGGTNITAELLLGRYETAQLTSTDGPVVVQSTVVPSQTLRQRQVVTTSGGPGRRPIPRTIVTILDRTNLLEIRASAKSNATLGDAVQIRVLTR